MSSSPSLAADDDAAVNDTPEQQTPVDVEVTGDVTEPPRKKSRSTSLNAAK